MKKILAVVILTANTAWADTQEKCLGLEPRSVNIVESFAHLLTMPFRATGCTALEALNGTDRPADPSKILPPEHMIVTESGTYGVRTWNGTTTLHTYGKK